MFSKGKELLWGSAILWGVLGFFLAMGGQMLAASIESMFGITPGSDNTAMLTNIAKASPIVIISMVVFAPFLEEIVFRRVIFGGVYMKTNFWIATLVSALVFAAVHNEFEHLLIYLMPALVFCLFVLPDKIDLDTDDCPCIDEWICRCRPTEL